MMVVGSACGAFGMDFGAFAEEYREVEDGSWPSSSYFEGFEID